MANILGLDGKTAQFLVRDNQGNESVGHFEITIVPSFERGTRCGDLAFVMDEQRKSAVQAQASVDLSLLRG